MKKTKIIAFNKINETTVELFFEKEFKENRITHEPWYGVELIRKEGNIFTINNRRDNETLNFSNYKVGSEIQYS